jgi:phosphoribosylformylglycinamidine synthase
MIFFFETNRGGIIAAGTSGKLSGDDITKLIWLFGMLFCPGRIRLKVPSRPRKEMITPWSTNAVEITQNMGIEGIKRIEEFVLLW